MVYYILVINLNKQKTINIIKNIFLTGLILYLSTHLCMLLQKVGQNSNYASMIFIFAVFLISRITDGFAYGIISSFISVLVANYYFTYPYNILNFTIAGYPLAIACMLTISVITSTLNTQIKRGEKLKTEAEKEKMRSNLLRAVSHDLRTPLTSISGSVSAVLESGDALSKSEKTELLQGAYEDVQWMIRLVENLLTVTRIEGGNSGKITKTPEAAEEIVSAALIKFKKRFPDTAVSVSVPVELLMIPVDAVLIEQVLINLLENAVYHGKNTTEIALSVTARDDMAVFTVKDNGAGIPDEKLPLLFTGILSSYEQAADGGHRNMGIGLSVCNTIIKAHGGRMTAENAPDGGAKFCFYLKIREDENEQ